MTSFRSLLLPLTSGILIGLSLTLPNPVQAAILTYDFEVEIDSDPLFGNSYSGFFSYDDDLVTDGDSEVDLSNFEFLFDGTTYTKNDALLAVAVFSDRVFLGIEYLANNLPDSPQITFLPKEDIFGFIEPPFFGYELASAEQGTGEITFTLRPPSPVSVPEPSAILGLLGFGFLGLNLNPSASSFPRPKAKK